MTASARDPSAPRYLEDFEIGDVTETGQITVTREMAISFAELYDPQPMHLDDEAARGTIFGELVASGWQTLALTMRLLVDAHLLGSTPIIGADFRETRFHAPLRPDQAIMARTEVTGKIASKSRPERGFLDMMVTTLAEDGTVLLTQNWRLVVPTRQAANAATDTA